MAEQQLDVIAVGAHPDDVEIGCGGTLARLAQQGHAVGIVDLTDGEPTPGSPGPEVRLAEAQKAAETLGVHSRLTLKLPNRCLFDALENRLALARVLRTCRPRLVLCIGEKTPMASPDHYQAMLITEAAVFYARLTKWEEYFDGLPPSPPAALMYYPLALRSLGPTLPHCVVVDISETLDIKLAALGCYQSQFAHRPEVLQRIRVFNQQQGLAAGFQAGELLASPLPLGTRDLMKLAISR